MIMGSKNIDVAGVEDSFDLPVNFVTLVHMSLFKLLGDFTLPNIFLLWKLDTVLQAI